LTGAYPCAHLQSSCSTVAHSSQRWATPAVAELQLHKLTLRPRFVVSAAAAAVLLARPAGKEYTYDGKGKVVLLAKVRASMCHAFRMALYKLPMRTA
jgi:hypothetical protein